MTPSTRVSTESPVLDIRELAVSYATAAGEVQAVRGFTLGVAAGECVGIVGESGAGKSQALLAVMGLLPPDARVQGSARFEGRELIGAHPRELDRVRGAGLSMIFQDPLLSLTPHLKIGDQIAESLVRHTGLGWKAARKRALQLLERVQIADPQRRMKQYPHELSGGMRQRVGLVRAFALGAPYLLMDEPFAALDEITRTEMRYLLEELREAGAEHTGVAPTVVFVTHSIDEAVFLSDRVVVLSPRPGRVVGDVRIELDRPRHPEVEETPAFFHHVTELRHLLREGRAA